MNGLISWSPGMTLEEVEKQAILKAIQFYRGNKTATANALGIAIRTLDAKLAKYKEDEVEHERRAVKEREERERFLKRQRGINPGVEGVSAEVARVAANKAEAAKPRVYANEREHLEPAKELSEKQSMPMSERQEVQSVSPKPSAPGSTRKPR